MSRVEGDGGGQGQGHVRGKAAAAGGGRILLLGALALACGGQTPATRYYALAPPALRAAPSAPAAAPTIAVEPLSADPPYDDERIVYRAEPYRVDYYEYHRWSAAPGTLVADYLARALARTGRFHAVLRTPDDATPVMLGGHVDAIEEVDVAPDRWVGHIAVELTATDRRTDAVLWSAHFDETEPLPAQSPEGLARALSTAMARIVARAAPIVAQLATKAGTSTDDDADAGSNTDAP